MYINPATLFLPFMVYLVLFVVLQQVINIRYGVKPVQRRLSIMELWVKSAGSLFLIVAAITFKKGTSQSLDWQAVRATGLLIMISGLWLSLRAHSELGKYWVGGIGLHKSHKLITTGPYRFVRHPLYTGLIVSGLGYGLVSLNIWLFLTGFSYCVSFVFRAPAEEKLLRKKFKMKYDNYVANTGMFFPKLRRS